MATLIRWMLELADVPSRTVRRTMSVLLVGALLISPDTFAAAVVAFSEARAAEAQDLIDRLVAEAGTDVPTTTTP